jgi:hypothetical protein
MSWRFRCTMHFTPGSGMAAWGKAQLDVRLTHDHDPNRLQANEEASHVTVTGDTLRADMFLAAEALALDTYQTFTDASVVAWLLPDTAEAASFVDYHECWHDGTPSPCGLTERWP